MSRQRIKGTTIIELIIATTVVAVMMTTVLLIWKSNTASARFCLNEISTNTQANKILSQLSRAVENLIEDEKDQSLEIENNSNKIIIKMFTRYNILDDQKYPFGPFITEYILDTQTGILKYRQSPSLAFDESFTELSEKWIEEKTRIKNITIEKINENKPYPIKIAVHSMDKESKETIVSSGIVTKEVVRNKK